MDQYGVYLPYLCLFKITVLFSTFLITINWWLGNCNFQFVEIFGIFFGFEVTKNVQFLDHCIYIYLHKL